jgi:hypothetical protein
MRWWRVFAAAAVGGLPLLISVGPAGASLDDPCTASGVIDGVTYDPKVMDEAEIPAEGDVNWTGSVPEGDGEERPIDGFVKVDLPAPLPDQELVGAWDSDSSTYSNSGTYHYELPSVLEGLEIRVYGEHNDAGFSCSGAMTVTVEGGGIGNPATIASLVLMVISIVGFALVVFVL